VDSVEAADAVAAAVEGKWLRSSQTF